MPQSQARRLVLATCSRVEGLVARGTQRFSRLSLRLSHEWDFQSRKTLSKFFQNFWLEVFWWVKLANFWRLTLVASRMPQSRARRSVLATCSRVEGPVARGTQRFSRLSLRLSHEWDFQSRKTLSKFFQNFWLEVFWRVKLATFWRLTSVAKISWFAKRSSFSTLFSKRVLIFFFFFFASYECSFFGLTFPISTPPWSTPKSSTILSPFSQSSRKGLGFVLYSLFFIVIAFSSWILCSLRYFYISWLYLGIWLSGVFIVCFPVVIYWSTLYCDNIGSLMTPEHSLSFSGHSHPVFRVFFIIHILKLTHC